MLLLCIISDQLLVKDGMSDGLLVGADFEGNHKKRSCFPVSFTKVFQTTIHNQRNMRKFKLLRSH